MYREGNQLLKPALGAGFVFEVKARKKRAENLGVPDPCRLASSGAENISFDDFCEYLLPYRSSVEPLEQRAQPALPITPLTK